MRRCGGPSEEDRMAARSRGSPRFWHRAGLSAIPYTSGPVTSLRRGGVGQLDPEVGAGSLPAIALYHKLSPETLGRFPNNMKYPDGSYARCLLDDEAAPLNPILTCEVYIAA